MRGLAWSVAALSAVTATGVLLAATLTPTPDPQPPLVTGPGWRVAQDVPGLVPHGPGTDDAWLYQGSVPGQGTRWAGMVRQALLDLHRLFAPSGAVAAGAGGRWNYAWPRDSSFVLVALARTGHCAQARQGLAFLQRVQLKDGGFQARYLMDGSGPPDDRAGQSDGAGWVLWAAGEVSASCGDAGPPAGLSSLLANATGFALAVTDEGRRLPPASPDYWETPLDRPSLGTVAPLLAGLRASQRMYAALRRPALARRSGTAAARLDRLARQRFADGYERLGSGRLGGGGLDAAVTFLMPPFAQSPASPSAQVVAAWTGYQSAARRPAGGLAPGSAWRQDGISWTPETALVAYTAATSGRPQIAAHWLDWLSAHRTPWGSLPEKVLATGAPAGPAPLAWTAALVVLTAAQLDSSQARAPAPAVNGR